jgi:hypothetical protein
MPWKDQNVINAMISEPGKDHVQMASPATEETEIS